MAPIDLKVRRLSPVDAALYREIRLEGLSAAPEAFGSTFEQEAAEPIAFFEERLEKSHILGAFRGTDIAGTAALGFGTGKRAHIGMLWGMYVRSMARKQGVGRRLVQSIVDIAREKVEVVQLVVVSVNAAALHLYESAGFELYGLEKKALCLDGRYYDEILMALDLTESR